MHKFHPVDQIEIDLNGIVHCKDALEAISHAAGRPYQPTESSLQRVVNAVNKYCELEVVKEGKSVSVLAWRKT